ncbi:N-ethylmaleimide reductase [Chitinophaga skermanii]|uniref:N-ethylmaleimide reductase n=1 Tax=Chitinophaga skermanii TaxID=331697 RepID=A0A327QMM7_9BACT|nr:alkene reductase [Chitinophaga skermanii]RAJ05125.1 N-ethylmaleimide reductase [Chitinophaga skermanii]
MPQQILFEPYQLGTHTLSNRIVMAPMTRSRAVNNLPNELIAAYYSQRASAGLIIVEGTSPSPSGTGYCRIPGIYTDTQIAAWQLTTQAVHEAGGKIFLQIMHTGRVAHALNIPTGGEIIAPSAIAVDGNIYTDAKGMQPYSLPRAIEIHEIPGIIAEHVQAAQNAIAAGFDGIEIHGAYGYLIEQFLSPNSNLRTDAYGGTIENRTRFLFELMEAITAAVGPDKVGLRLSPYNTAYSIGAYDAAIVHDTYAFIAEKMAALNIVYLHVSTNAGTDAQTLQAIRDAFPNTIIQCGTLTAATASELIHKGAADLAAFGKPFIANPDLVLRFKNNHTLNECKPQLFYTPGGEGLVDYPCCS